MQIDQYEKWINTNFLKGTNLLGFFKKAIKLENIKIKGVRNEVESSFNSRDKLGLLKITHIFYRLGGKKDETISALNFIKTKKLIDFLKDVNKKLKFNIQILRKILNLSLAPMVKESKNFVVNFDFKKGRLTKMSISLNPKNLRQLFKILSKDLSILPKIENEKLAFINVDFYPNKITYLKIYYFYNMSESILYKPLLSVCILKRGIYQRISKIFNILLKMIPPDYVFIMKKLDKGGRLRFGGIYFNYDRPQKIRTFLAIKYLRETYPFLKSLQFLIKDFRISFLAMKPKNVVEVYFR